MSVTLSGDEKPLAICPNGNNDYDINSVFWYTW